VLRKLISFGVLSHFTVALSAQAWQVFDMAGSGLPSNTVTDMAIQDDGVVWAATDWGLWRWENGEYEVFQQANSGLPDNYLRALSLDSQGRLWIGTSMAGAVMYDGQDWEVFSTFNSPMPDDQVNTIHEDSNGWLWFGTVTGLACYTGTEWRIYNSSPSSYNGRILHGDHILSIDTRPDGLIALGTLNGGFHFLTDTSVHFFTTFNSGFWDNTQRGVLFDLNANERWVATPAAGLLRQFGDWYGGTWFQYTTFNSNLPSNGLVDLAQSSDGSLWIATQVAGLVQRFPNGSYQSFTEANSGLPANTLNRIKMANDGALWVAMYDGGLARFDPTLDVQDQAHPDGLQVIPSVNDGSFRVVGFDSSGKVSWSITDHQGRVILNGKGSTASELRFEGLGLSPGAYILTLHGEGMSRSGRFLVH